MQVSMPPRLLFSSDWREQMAAKDPTAEAGSGLIFKVRVSVTVALLFGSFRAIRILNTPDAVGLPTRAFAVRS